MSANGAMDQRARDRLLSAALAVIVAGVAVLALGGDLDLRVVAIALCVAGAAWAAAVALVCNGAGSLRMILVGAVLLRLVALTAPAPRLSDDIYRYLWEGELVLAGVSPYTFVPADAELAGHQSRLDELYRRVNHKDVSAAYPPLAQVTGALAAAIARATDGAPEEVGVFVLRALFTACDLLVLVPLIALLRRASLPPTLACAWAWSPLAASEFAAAGHLDSLGILLLLGGLAVLQRPALDRASSASRSARARWLLIAGGLVKYLPWIALPWAFRATPRARLLAAAVALAACALACAPFLWMQSGDHALFDGLSAYGLRWESASLVYRWVAAACALALDPAPGWSDPARVARLIVGLFWLAFACVTWVRCADPIAGCARLIALFLVLSPTLHPWYLTWMIPFLALRPRAAWLWLAAVVPVAYWPLARWQREGVWIEPAWLWPLIAVPFFTLVIWTAIWGRGTRTTCAVAPLAGGCGREPDQGTA